MCGLVAYLVLQNNATISCKDSLDRVGRKLAPENRRSPAYFIANKFAANIIQENADMAKPARAS